MSHDTLRAIVAALPGLVRLPPRLTIVWHAGEPLVMPTRWYRTAFAICDELARHGTHVDHSMQTNGTLIDDDWCALIKELDIHVGVSLDGPEQLNDRHRRTRKGQGSFERVMTGIRRLQTHGIPFHVICVLTRDSLRVPDTMYRFFADSGITEVAFNIEETEGSHEKTSLSDPGVVALHRDFMTRFRVHVTADNHAMHVREFDQTLGAVTRSDPCGLRNQQVEPCGILTCDWRGNVSAFSPELIGQPAPAYGNFLFGNLVTDKPLRLSDSIAYRRTLAEIEAGVAACRRECGYFDVCGGGAPANKFYELGGFDGTETLYCRLTKQNLVDIVVEELERELDAIQGGPS
jgi:uncharacterized protein